MVDLDTANSRMKDFFDIWTLAGHLSFDGSTLARAIAATFERRATALPTEVPTCLTDIFFAAPDPVRQWRAFVGRIEQSGLADNFPRIASDIAEFVMPPSIAAATKQEFASHWLPGGPWRPCSR